MGILETVGTVVGIGSKALDIYSTYQGGKDTQEHYDFQSEKAEQVAKLNAKNIRDAAKKNQKLSLYDAYVAEKEANEIVKASEIQARNYIKTTSKILASQKTNYAKSGVAVGTGTPLEVQKETAGEIVRDALIIKYNGQTASKRAKDLARRYRFVAKTGLENAYAHASMIEEAGVYDASYYGKLADSAGSAALYGTVGKSASAVYSIGQDQGWWK